MKDFYVTTRGSVCDKCKTENHLSGQSFTYSKCKNCGVGIVNPTTRQDNYCYVCSQELNICAECGESLETKNDK